ncbi:MAG: MOSC domain-containing protein [Vulcanimicrobiaceae bacterium]
MNLDGALVLSVNISAGQTVQYRGNWLTTGIFKTPVEGPVMLADTRLRGDVQADLKVHGGFERAAYAYAEEDYLWWQGRLGKTLPFGKFGENFTLRGIDISGALIGERWQIGRAVVQVTSPRIPCFKLGITMQDPKFVKRFAEALRPGAYLRIIQEGEVAAGDPVDLVWKPDHEVTVKEMTRIYMYERDKLGEILVPELPQDWREWVLAETGT